MMRVLILAMLVVACCSCSAPSDSLSHSPLRFKRNERVMLAPREDLGAFSVEFEGGMFFGDGSTGPCNWDGSTTVDGDAPFAPNANDTLPAGTTAVYDISSWKFCSSATVSLHVAVHGLFPIFVDGNLQLDGAIVNNGCSPSVANTACNNTDGGGLAGLMNRGTGSESANTGVSCFFIPIEADKSSITNCANAVAIGANGLPGALPGCGGGGGGSCAFSATAGRAAPKSTVSAALVGLGDITANDGYISFVSGTNGTGCAGTSGGSIGNIGINPISESGGGAGWVDVHARTITGSGDLEARGGNAKAPGNSTGGCSGGGGGGGGGIVTVVISSGSYPSMNITGGNGTPGQLCVTPGACAGAKGGDGANGHDGFVERFTK